MYHPFPESELPNRLGAGTNDAYRRLTLNPASGDPDYFPIATAKYVVLRLINTSGSYQTLYACPDGVTTETANRRVEPHGEAPALFVRLNNTNGWINVIHSDYASCRILVVGWGEYDSLLNAPVRWTAGTDYTWITRTYAPSGFTAALVLFRLESKGSVAGLRKPGTTGKAFQKQNNYYTQAAVAKPNASNQVDLYQGGPTGNIYSHWGWLDDREWAADDNWAEVGASVETGAWYATTISKPGARAFIIAVQNEDTSARRGSVRTPGATMNFNTNSLLVPYASSGDLMFYTVGCDELGRIEIYRELSAVKFYLVGWATGNVLKYGEDFACGLDSATKGVSSASQDTATGFDSARIGRLIYSSWRVRAATEKPSAWRIFAQPLEKYAAWRIRGATPLQAAWRVFAGQARSSGWRLFSRGTLASSWAIMASELLKTSAWRIRGLASRACSWRLFAASNRLSSWMLRRGRGQDSAWRLFGAATAPASWRLFGAATLASAWAILTDTILYLQSAWRIRAESTREAGWRLRGAVTTACAWKDYAFGYLTARWRIWGSQDRPSSWRLRSLVSQVASWRLFRLLSLAGAWRLRNLATRTASWRLFGRQMLASAWAILAAAGVYRTCSWRVRGAAEASSEWRLRALVGRACAWKAYKWLSRLSAWAIGRQVYYEPEYTFTLPARPKSFSLPARKKTFTL